MNKKSQSVGWEQVFYAFVTVIVVGAAVWIFYPKISSLADTIKSTFGLGKAEANPSKNTESKTSNEPAAQTPAGQNPSALNLKAESNALAGFITITWEDAPSGLITKYQLTESGNKICDRDLGQGSNSCIDSPSPDKLNKKITYTLTSYAKNGASSQKNIDVVYS